MALREPIWEQQEQEDAQHFAWFAEYQRLGCDLEAAICSIGFPDGVRHVASKWAWEARMRARRRDEYRAAFAGASGSGMSLAAGFALVKENMLFSAILETERIRANQIAAGGIDAAKKRTLPRTEFPADLTRWIKLLSDLIEPPELKRLMTGDDPAGVLEEQISKHDFSHLTPQELEYWAQMRARTRG